MASYLVQSGTTLYLVTRAGVQTAITLPMGVTLTGAASRCRVVVFGASNAPQIIVVGGLTKDIYISSSGVARVLQIAPPVAAPALTAGAATDLTGAYTVWVSFKVKDDNGKTLIESALSPASTPSAALTNQTLRMDGIPVSSESTVNSRGIYRSMSGGNVPYPWFDIDDNSTLAEDRGVVDALLALLPTTAVSIGTPPDLALITTWKDRLWATPRLKPDYTRWTEERVFYAWNPTNELVVPPLFTDAYGVTAYIPRRDQLGIARRNRLYQVTGDSNDTFQRTCISEILGCVSQESVVVVRDIAYFLGERGIVEWTADSVGYVSEAQVDPWFTSDTYFNRALFSSVQGRYNPSTDAVEFLLPAAGSSNLDRWIAFDLKRRCWLGPHTTAAFTPTCCGTDSSDHGILTSSQGYPLAVFGASDGYLYYRDDTNADDDQTAVALDVTLPALGGFDPAVTKVWRQPAVHTRAETAAAPGNRLIVTPTVGDLSASASPAQVHDLTREHGRLGRLGFGRYLSLRLQHSGVGESVRIFGIDLPFLVRGRR